MSARRPWLWPLTPGYAAGLWVKERLLGLPERLHRPVVSVGSVSAGGAGKTPVVQMLVELLLRRGETPVVLSRGYGRSGVATERVDVAGEAARFGDEPLLLARQTGAAVFVGGDRYVAGLVAELEAREGTVFVLDDGFQHRGLGRDVDVVLVTREDVEDALLPAGNLREPLRALRRADMIVLRDEEADELEPKVRRWTMAPVWRVRRRLSFAEEMPKRPLVFCGIARPEGFLAMLREMDCPVMGEMVFADHHAYSESDLKKLTDKAQYVRADAFVTTEKDAARLTAAARARLESVAPVVAVRLETELVDAEAGMDWLLARLRPQATA